MDRITRPQGARGRTIDTVLVVLVVSILAPVLCLVAIYGVWNVRLLDRAVERNLTDTARALSLGIDQELAKVQAVAQALALSPHLDAGDLAAFHAQARDVSGQHGGWAVLTDRSLHQVVNTRRPWGEELPSTSAPDIVHRIFATGQPGVSDLFFGKVVQRHVVTVLVPVIRDGTVEYVLDITFLPDRFSVLLDAQDLPAGWTALLVDSRNVVIGRSGAIREQVGSPAPAWLVHATQSDDAGLLRREPLDGSDMAIAFRQSPTSGWTTVVAAPVEVVREPALQAAAILAGAAFISLCLACAAAILLGRQISGPLRRLAKRAGEIVEGGGAVTPESTIDEVAEVHRALTRAAAAHREQTATGLRLAQEQRARAESEEARRRLVEREQRLHSALVALQQSEERYRGLVEALASVVWTTNADGNGGDRLQWRALTGQTDEESAGLGWLNALHPDDRERTRETWWRALERSEPYATEYRVRDREGVYRWYSVRSVPVCNADGSIREWIGVCLDIDERKAAEERQALLTAELDHRVRNILATVQAMISLSRSSAGDKEEYVRRLRRRIAAMARAHGLLTRQKWKGASLTQIVGDELRPYAHNPDVVSIRGEPDCLLNAKQALNLALVLHELTTNAVKYGALSLPSGRIEVRWSIVRNGGDPRLVLEWQESGGPQVRKPDRRGFGSTLFDSALSQQPGTIMRVEYDPAGVRCRIEMPLYPEHQLFSQSPAADSHG